MVDIDPVVHIDWFVHQVHNLLDIVHIDHLHYYLDNPIQK
jgi:hypothetical protein